MRIFIASLLLVIASSPYLKASEAESIQENNACLSNDVTTDASCYICTEDIPSPSLISLSCNHYMHRDCLLGYLKRMILTIDEFAEFPCGICRQAQSVQDLNMQIVITLDDMLNVYISDTLPWITPTILKVISRIIERFLAEESCVQTLQDAFSLPVDIAELMHEKLSSFVPLDLEKLHDGEYRQMLGEIFPNIHRGHIHEALFAAIRHYEVTTENVDLWTARGGALPFFGSLLPLAIPYIRVLKYIIGCDDPAREINPENPFIKLISTLPHDHLKKLIIHQTFKEIVHLNSGSRDAFQNLSFYALIGIYQLYQTLVLTSNQGVVEPFLRDALSNLIPLRFNEERLDESAQIISSIILSREGQENTLNQIGQLSALHPQITDQLRSMQERQRQVSLEHNSQVIPAFALIGSILFLLLGQQVYAYIG